MVRMNKLGLKKEYLVGQGYGTSYMSFMYIIVYKKIFIINYFKSYV